MKKSFILFIILILFTLVGCKKDNPKDITDEFIKDFYTVSNYEYKNIDINNRLSYFNNLFNVDILDSKEEEISFIYYSYLNICEEKSYLTTVSDIVYTYEFETTYNYEVSIKINNSIKKLSGQIQLEDNKIKSFSCFNMSTI